LRWSSTRITTFSPCRAEPAVLWQPLLRDVHARHDLEAGDQPFVDPLGQVHDFLEQAVEAVADEDAFLHRLDVDIAGLALDGALHDEIDQVDDRRRLAALFETGNRLFEDGVLGPPRQRGIGARHVVALARSQRHRSGGHGKVASRLRRRENQRLVRVPGLNRVHDVTARRDHLFDAIAGLELEILDEAEEQRVRHRDREKVLLQTDGHAHALERDLFGDQDDSRRIRWVLCKVDVRKAELKREGLGDLLFGGEVHPHEHDADTFAGAPVLFERDAEIVFGDEARLDQALTNLLTQRETSARRVRGGDGFRLYGASRG
jgi:hypothetical protein